MSLRGRLGVALIGGLVAGCNATPQSPATLAPLTAAPLTAAQSSTTASADQSSTGSFTPGQPSETPSVSPSATLSATSVGDPSTGDPSAGAAVKAAELAVAAFDSVGPSLDLTRVTAITTPECPCVQRMRSVKALLIKHHSRIVTAPLGVVRGKIVSQSGTTVRVRVDYTEPGHKEVTASGKVLTTLPAYALAEIYEMHYVANHWLVAFTEFL